MEASQGKVELKFTVQKGMHFIEELEEGLNGEIIVYFSQESLDHSVVFLAVFFLKLSQTSILHLRHQDNTLWK